MTTPDNRVLSITAALATVVFVGMVMWAKLAEGSDYVEIVQVKEIRFAPEWRLVQLVDGWAIYYNPNDTGTIQLTPYMIAVKADGIPGRLRFGERLIFQVGIETRLRRLPDLITKGNRGFDVTMQRYEVLRQQSPTK